MATKVGMYSATHESVTVARGQKQENTKKKKKNEYRTCDEYIWYISGQPSWCPLWEDSMQISCADNPTFQRLEIRKMDLDRALLPGLSCSPLAYYPSFKGLCVFYFQVVSILTRQANSPVFLASCCWSRPSWPTLEVSIFSRRCCHWSSGFVFPTGATTLYKGVSRKEHFHRFHELFDLFHYYFFNFSFVFGNPDETLALVFEIVVRNCTIRQNLLLIWPLNENQSWTHKSLWQVCRGFVELQSLLCSKSLRDKKCRMTRKKVWKGLEHAMSGSFGQF